MLAAQDETGHKLKEARIEAVKTWIGIMLILLAALPSGILSADETPTVWAKGFTSEGAGKTGLQLIGVDQSKEGLSGLFVYYNIASDESRTEPVVIAGARSRTDVFWAGATIEVKKATASEWEMVGQSKVEGVAETMTVLSNESSKVFRVDFDNLKRFIATHKMGRVITSNGAIAQFDLEALNPPTNTQN